jgi:hypothetical protein
MLVTPTAPKRRIHRIVSGTEFHLLLSKKLGYRWPVSWSRKIPAKEKVKQRVGAWKIK